MGDAAPGEARRLVDGEDLAKLLSVSPRTVKRLVLDGKIDGIPVGGRLRFDPVEVIANLKAQAAAARAAAKDEKK